MCRINCWPDSENDGTRRMRETRITQELLARDGGKHIPRCIASRMGWGSALEYTSDNFIYL